MRQIAIGFGFIAAFLLAFSVSAQDLSPQERDQLTQQLAQLEREAASLDGTITQLQGQARTLKNEVSLLNNQIKQHELEIRRLTLVIRQADVDITRKQKNIQVSAGKIQVAKQELSASVRELSQADQNNLLELMLKNESLSEFFIALNDLEKVQGNIQQKMADLRVYKASLEKEKAELEDFREGQAEAKSIAEVERRSIQQAKKERDQLLAETQGKEANFQALLKEKQTAINALKNKLFYLQQIGLTPEDALRYAKLAASRTGIRTAFLLGLLEVETGKQFADGQITAGTHLGTGNWRVDMYQCYINLGKITTAENQKNAFFKITASLGLDPDKMPVSRKPNYGCGGAMGPAQFIPTTWFLFADRVGALTGSGTANPWNPDHAFTAAGLYLADSGARAQTKTGEIAAARTYISGRPNCPAYGSARTACLSYGIRVWRLSQAIERAINP